MLDDDPEKADSTRESVATSIAVLKAQVKMIRDVMVTKYEFAPVKLITYGLVAIIIGGVLTALLSYVVKHSN